jgi:hypothetical protein
VVLVEEISIELASKEMVALVENHNQVHSDLEMLEGIEIQTKTKILNQETLEEKNLIEENNPPKKDKS